MMLEIGTFIVGLFLGFNLGIILMIQLGNHNE